MTKSDAIDLLMLLSALESWSFAAEHRMPEILAARLDAAVAALRAEVLEGVNNGRNVYGYRNDSNHYVFLCWLCDWKIRSGQ